MHENDNNVINLLYEAINSVNMDRHSSASILWIIFLYKQVGDKLLVPPQLKHLYVYPGSESRIFGATRGWVNHLAKEV